MKLLSEETGYTKMQMHYLCMALCFGVLVDEHTGREVPVVPASRYLTPAQFSELVEWVIPWAWDEWSVVIPTPNEVDYSTLPGVDEEAA